MSFLKYLGETDPVKSLLHTCVGGYQPRRPAKRIHASGLTSPDREFCPREYRLLDESGRSPGRDWVDTARQITFDDGWDKQSRVVNKYLRSHVVGQWRCRSCRTTSRFGRAPVTSDCALDKSCLWEYSEAVFRHALIPALTGSIDCLLARKGKLRVVEIKIMGPNEFPKIAAPVAEHRRRTALYLQLIAQSDSLHRKSIDTSEASILYCMRSHGMKDSDGTMSPFKEYKVLRDDSLNAVLMDRAATVRMTRESGAGAVGICSTGECPRAKACPVADICFSPETGIPEEHTLEELCAGLEGKSVAEWEELRNG